MLFRSYTANVHSANLEMFRPVRIILLHICTCYNYTCEAREQPMKTLNKALHYRYV